MAFSTLFCKRISVSPKISVLPSQTLYQTLDLEKFCHGTLTIASVVNLVQVMTVASYLTEHQPLCTWWHDEGRSSGPSGSWAIMLPRLVQFAWDPHTQVPSISAAFLYFAVQKSTANWLWKFQACTLLPSKSTWCGQLKNCLFVKCNFFVSRQWSFQWSTLSDSHCLN